MANIFWSNIFHKRDGELETLFDGSHGYDHVDHRQNGDDNDQERGAADDIKRHGLGSLQVSRSGSPRKSLRFGATRPGEYWSKIRHILATNV